MYYSVNYSIVKKYKKKVFANFIQTFNFGYQIGKIKPTYDSMFNKFPLRSKLI
jgi:hypothetical protein